DGIRTYEHDRDVDDRWSDDAFVLLPLPPSRHARGDKELKRRRAHPAQEIRIEDDLRRIAIAELDTKTRDVASARPDGAHRAACDASRWRRVHTIGRATTGLAGAPWRFNASSSCWPASSASAASRASRT